MLFARNAIGNPKLFAADVKLNFETLTIPFFLLTLFENS